MPSHIAFLLFLKQDPLKTTTTDPLVGYAASSDQGQAFRSTPAYNAPNGFIWKYFKNTIIFLFRQVITQKIHLFIIFFFLLSYNYFLYN
ncbi:MAG TPA: hypothetical protein DIT32_06730 [Peptococcaceae bacterium]|nr:hypothetical protein [Peptococcaceae bacterium]